MDIPDFPEYPPNFTWEVSQESRWIAIGTLRAKGNFCNGSPELINGPTSYAATCGERTTLPFNRPLYVSIPANKELKLHASVGRKIEDRTNFQGPPDVLLSVSGGTFYYFHVTEPGQDVNPDDQRTLRYPSITIDGSTIRWQRPIIAYTYYFDILSAGGNRSFSSNYRFDFDIQNIPPNPPEDNLDWHFEPPPPPPPPPPPCDIQIGIDDAIGDGYFCMNFTEYEAFITRNRNAGENLDRIVNNLRSYP